MISNKPTDTYQNQVLKIVTNFINFLGIDKNLGNILRLRYQGKSTQAVKELSKLHYDNSPEKDLLKLLKISLLFDSREIPQAIELLNENSEFMLKSNVKIGGEYLESLQHLIKAQFSSSKGNYLESIKSLEEGVKLLKDSRYNLELMHLNYRIANKYRLLGDIEKTREYLELSLKKARDLEDDYHKGIFLNLISEILFKSENLNLAISLLNESKSLWFSLEMNFGIAWVLHDLGVSYELQGDYKKALTALDQSYSLSKDTLDPYYKVKTLLSIIQCCNESREFGKSEFYLSELKTIAKDEKKFNREVILGQAMLDRIKGSIRQIFNSENKLKQILKINNTLDFEFLVKTLINTIDLLLFEFQSLNESDIEKDIIDLTKKLEKLNKSSYSILVNTYYFKSKLERLNGNYSKAEDLMNINLDFMKNKGFKNNKVTQELLILQKITQMEEFSLLSPDFNIIHSLPRLKIILYILARNCVSFSELEKATKLTSGNLASHIKKLESSKIINIEKKFLNTKLTTVYSLTSDGIQLFTKYSRNLSDILKEHIKY